MKKPDATQYRRGDNQYLRELVAGSGLSQREAARVLGVDERTMRSWLAGRNEFPYAVQYSLESLNAICNLTRRKNMTIRVVNGKRYDTEKSIRLANLRDSDNPNEARRLTYLYKTNKGEFFTLSMKFGREGHNMYDVTTVEPLSEVEAKDALWNAEYSGRLTFDDLVALQPHFGIDLQGGIEDA